MQTIRESGIIYTSKLLSSVTKQKKSLVQSDLRRARTRAGNAKKMAFY